MIQKNILHWKGGRGCPFSCTFCSTQKFWGNVFVVKPIDILISEIKQYHEKYSAYKFSITHDLFTANKKYLLEFCFALNNLSFDVKWGCSSRLDVLDDEMITAMICAGCTDIYIGVESASSKIQKLISKNLDIESLNYKVSLLLTGGISCILSFIYGFPYEDEQDMDMSLQKIYDLKRLEKKLAKAVLTIQFHRLTYLPGTEIIENYFEDLEFEGINTMSYFDEDIDIPQLIQKMLVCNKTGFLNCYNLKSNMNKFYNHLGDFVCLWFNLFYSYFSLTIDLIILRFSTLVSMFKYIYVTDSNFFLETIRFYNYNFEEEKETLLLLSFVDFVENVFMDNQIDSYDQNIGETLKKEYSYAIKKLNLPYREFS